jgi:hypothetical protein
MASTNCSTSDWERNRGGLSGSEGSGTLVAGLIASRLSAIAASRHWRSAKTALRMAARARASGEHTTVVRRSEPGTTFTWVALPLEGKWEQITDAAGANPAVCAPFQRGGGHGAYGLRSGPDELSAPEPPESASATVGAATWPRRLIMPMLRRNRTAVGTGVRGGRS